MRLDRLRSALLLLSPLVAACIGAPDGYEDEGLTDEAQLAFSITKDMLTVNESPSGVNTWPKTVTWCLVGDHAPHVRTPADPVDVQWDVSWSPSDVPSSGPCISRTLSEESCDSSAMVVRDSAFHTGNTADPKAHIVYDHRASFAILPSSYTVPVNQSVSLVAPGPHGTRHCDGTGSFVWQIKLANGTWQNVSSNVQTLAVNNTTPGTETYRVRSTHQNFVSTSNEIVVTWVAPPAGCTIGGVTYTNGAFNPSNKCQVCDTSISTTSWSNKNGQASSGVCKSSGVCGGLITSSCAGSPCTSDLDCTTICLDGERVCGGRLD
ncbi:hypothetical protein [Polyangium sorediatum]|uniref:Lipoprotein n=1 Tax=Polyangium sorediatum TaxID=889274 RepID=A0ABT6NU96_9BACT|nr:hypothetical protein [Polyangium sorediatum]MDI1431887.1 hypothetical protein [Polyangium sorediatum]